MAYTRATLFTEVMEDLNREDKIDRLPGWLLSAEGRINNALRHEKQVCRALLEVVDKTFAPPPNFIEQKSMTLRHHLEDPVRPGEAINGLKYMPTDQADDGYGQPNIYDPRAPLWYTQHGETYELTNWNKEGLYQIDLWYYSALPILTLDEDTNWFLQKYPHIYKDAMLHFGFRHLQEFDNADRCLVSMTGEINFINEQSAAGLYKGPLIARAQQSIGSRTNVRRYR